MTDQPQNSPILPDWQRDEFGRFVPGSGGRPKGSFNAVSKRALSQLHQLSDSAMDALKENIAKNDQRAIEFVLSKVLPAGGRVVEIEASSKGIREAVQNGELSLSELKDMAAALNSVKMLSEIDQMRDELDQLKALLRG